MNSLVEYFGNNYGALIIGYFTGVAITAITAAIFGRPRRVAAPAEPAEPAAPVESVEPDPPTNLYDVIDNELDRIDNSLGGRWFEGKWDDYKQLRQDTLDKLYPPISPRSDKMVEPHCCKRDLPETTYQPTKELVVGSRVQLSDGKYAGQYGIVRYIGNGWADVQVNLPDGSVAVSCPLSRLAAVPPE